VGTADARSKSIGPATAVTARELTEPAVIENPKMRAALLAATKDQIVFDLEGIERKYDALTRELPGVKIRFAIKACPVNEVLACLARKGAGFDAASPNEITQALNLGAPAGVIHYGNTIKSNQQISDAYRLGIRDYATDSFEDVEAIAVHARNSRVFCRLATNGHGALWGLSRKFGCPADSAIEILQSAHVNGLQPAGLSVHVGSQQMLAGAWQSAFDNLADVGTALNKTGIALDYINLGGGLPAMGYTDNLGQRLLPPLNSIFAAIRTGMRRLKQIAGKDLDFIIEPGRYMVADQAVIRAHVARLAVRQQLNGDKHYWLYLSCGKFNGLYETDKLRYQLVFPTHAEGEYVPAMIAGPTCDSDDAFCHQHGFVQVPKKLLSGDPVWILSCGAYSTSYSTQGFNGFKPLPLAFVHGLAESAALAESKYAGNF
jgi:ornithine decarboxylase